MKEFIEKLIGRLSKNSIFRITTNSEGKNVFEIIEELAEEYKDKPDDEWQIIYDKVCDLEKKYAKVDGDMENVNCCIRLENLLQYFKEELRSAEEHKGGWIPCSERLPENNKVVLCWVKSTTIASGETYIIGSCDRGFWFLQTYEIGHHHFPVKDYEVVAWQPLPGEYKEREEVPIEM